MLTKQLQVVIQTSLDAGKSKEEVAQLLEMQGFSDEQITTLFQEYESGAPVVTPPGAAGSEPASLADNPLDTDTDLQGATITETSLQQQQQEKKEEQRRMAAAPEAPVIMPNPKLVQQQRQAAATPTMPASAPVPPAPNPAPVAPPVQEPVAVSTPPTMPPVNVGLGGIPELNQAQAFANSLGKEKSAAPMVLVLIIILFIIGGFLGWYFLLGPGSESVTEDDMLQTIQTQEEGIPDPATLDPFTGQAF